MWCSCALVILLEKSVMYCQKAVTIVNKTPVIVIIGTIIGIYFKSTISTNPKLMFKTFLASGNEGTCHSWSAVLGSFSSVANSQHKSPKVQHNSLVCADFRSHYIQFCPKYRTCSILFLWEFLRKFHRKCCITRTKISPKIY